MDDYELPLNKKERKQLKKWTATLASVEVRLKPREMEANGERLRLKKNIEVLFESARIRLEAC